MMKEHRTLAGIGIAVLTTLTLSGCATNLPGSSSPTSSTSGAQTNQATSTNATGGSAGNSTATSTGNSTGSSAGGSTGSNSSSNSSTATASGSTSSGGTNATGSSTTVSTSSTSPASSANGAGVSTQTGATSQSAFPTIMNMAMQQFSANVLVGAEAPTTVPMPASGSNELFYKTAESTTPIMSHPGFLSSYSVTLSSPKHQIADFSDHRFDTSAHASQLMSYTLMDVPLSGTQSAVSVGQKHHQAILAVESNHSASVIGWTEGNWTIRVKDTANSSAPMSAANEVADYLDAHFMPIPQDKGSIVVETGASGTVAVVTWQENNMLYETDANEYASNPISTALQMSISMRRY